jgi:hypothetical protein
VFASPVTVQLCVPVGGVALKTVQLNAPVDAVTTYVVATPLAVNVTAAEVLLATAVGAANVEVAVYPLEVDVPAVVLFPLGVNVNV